MRYLSIPTPSMRYLHYLRIPTPPIRYLWQFLFFFFRFLQLFSASAVLGFHAIGYSAYQTYYNLVNDNGTESDFTPNALYFMWFIVATISIIASIGLCFVTLARSRHHICTPSERRLAILMSFIWLVFAAIIMIVDGGIRDYSTVAQVDDDIIQAAEVRIFWCWNYTCGLALVTLFFWVSGACCMYLWILIDSKGEGDQFIAGEDSDMYSPWRASTPSSRMASIASLERITPSGSRSYKNQYEYKTPRQIARLSMISQQSSRPSTPMNLTRPVSLVSVESNVNELLTVRDGSIHSASSTPAIGNPLSSNQKLDKSKRLSAPVAQLSNPSQNEAVSVEIMSEARDGENEASRQEQEQLQEQLHVRQQRQRQTSTPEMSRLVVPQQDESVSVEVVTEMAGTEVINQHERQQQQEMAEQ